jgi:hypothetical protein
MKSPNKFPLFLITALAAIGESAYGQQPPDTVSSDANGNSAMGSSALLRVSWDLRSHAPRSFYVYG